MGMITSRFFITQGYYYDMVMGFPTKAGGRPAVIPYPKGLLDLPSECPKCKSRSGLKMNAMKELLFEARRMFQSHAEGIVVQRLMSGDPNPYFGFIESAKKAGKGKDKKKSSSKTCSSDSSANMLSCLKRNEVSPQTKIDLFEGEKHVDNTWEDYLGFEVDRNDLVICRCTPGRPARYQKNFQDGELEISKYRTGRSDAKNKMMKL